MSGSLKYFNDMNYYYVLHNHITSLFKFVDPKFELRLRFIFIVGVELLREIKCACAEAKSRNGRFCTSEDNYKLNGYKKWI